MTQATDPLDVKHAVCDDEAGGERETRHDTTARFVPHYRTGMCVISCRYSTLSIVEEFCPSDGGF